MTMPQTRHYEMKDSGVEWIGEIPIGWKVIRNKALFGEVNERCGASPNLTLLSVSEYYGVAPRAEKIAEDEMLTRAESLEGYKICHKNDIVMNIMLAWKRSQGVSQYDGIVSPAYCVFRRKDDAPIDMRYIHYLIRTDRYADEYKCHSTGIIDSRLRLYPDKFLALESHVPPLSEQTAIAAYLDEKCATIDAIITEAKASIEEYKSWKASVIFETVTKGLNPNAEMKDSGVEWIGKTPEHWTIAKQKYFVTLINGRAYADNEFKSDGKYRVLRVGNFFTNSSWYYSDLELESDKYCDDGDLLYAWSASYGPKIWDGGKVIYHYHIWKCKLGKAVDKMFCYYYYLALGQFVANSAHGTAMMHITMQMMNNAFMPIPPLPEQTAIASYLATKCASIDGVIAEKEELIGELETYKKSLIFEVVTGKRRVC